MNFSDMKSYIEDCDVLFLKCNKDNLETITLQLADCKTDADCKTVVCSQNSESSFRLYQSFTSKQSNYESNSKLLKFIKYSGGTVSFLQERMHNDIPASAWESSNLVQSIQATSVTTLILSDAAQLSSFSFDFGLTRMRSVKQKQQVIVVYTGNSSEINWINLLLASLGMNSQKSKYEDFKAKHCVNSNSYWYSLSESQLHIYSQQKDYDNWNGYTIKQVEVH